jgi:hypothetical protein
LSRVSGTDRFKGSRFRFNHHRCHTAIGGPPANRVTNLAGHYSSSRGVAGAHERYSPCGKEILTTRGDKDEQRRGQRWDSG